MLSFSSKPSDLQAKMDAISRSQAVIEFEIDGTIIEANENFLGALGYQLEEIKGQHHRMFVEKEEANSNDYQQFWRTLASGEFRSGEFKRITKNGDEIWIQASYNPLFDKDGKVFKIVKFASDITEQKLKNFDYEGQVKAISRSQAVIQFELDGTIITANDNFLNALGYSLDEIQGQHHRMFIDPQEANSAEYKQFWDDLGNGKFKSDEYKRFGKGGKEIWIQASYNPILDQSGKPIKVIKFATDITAAVQDRIRRAQIQASIDTDLSEIMEAIVGASTQASEAASASTQTSQNVQAVAGGLEELSSGLYQIT